MSTVISRSRWKKFKRTIGGVKHIVWSSQMKKLHHNPNASSTCAMMSSEEDFMEEMELTIGRLSQ